MLLVHVPGWMREAQITQCVCAVWGSTVDGRYSAKHALNIDLSDSLQASITANIAIEVAIRSKGSFIKLWLLHTNTS